MIHAHVALQSIENAVSRQYQWMSDPELGCKTASWLELVRANLESSIKFDFGEASESHFSGFDFPELPELPFEKVYGEFHFGPRILGGLCSRHGDALSFVMFGNHLPDVRGYSIIPVEYFARQTPSGPEWVGVSDCGHENTDISKDYIKAHTDIAWAFLSYFHLMSCSNITYIDNPAPKHTNRQREKKGKPPLFSYKTLHISTKDRTVSKSEPQGTHASPRVHLRRGHIRTLASGKAVWVQPCVVGDRSRGMIHKDYAVDAA